MTQIFPTFQLVAADLAAERGYRRLFADMSFKLASGELMELRGPNGSGKTTLLRILAGLTRPAAGEAALTLDGAAAETASNVHYLGHLNAVKADETALGQLRFWARYYGAEPKDADAALDRVGLARRADIPGRGLSAGQKRRLAAARLLLAPRAVWLLDEPAAGLDAAGAQLMGALVAEHRAAGGGVIAAVHDDAAPDARPLNLEDYAPALASAS